MLLLLLLGEIVVVENLLQKIGSLVDVSHLEEGVGISEVLLDSLVICVEDLQVLGDSGELVDPDLVFELGSLA